MSSILALCCGLASFGVEPKTLTLADALPVQFRLTHHVQGIATDGKRWFISSVDRANKSGWVFVINAETMKLDRSLRLALGDQYHPGGMQLQGNLLYVPLAEYREKSSTTMVILNTDTFRVEKVHFIDDHIGACAATTEGKLYLANWDSRDVYTVAPDGKVLEKRANPTGVAYQDWKFHEGKLWGAGNTKVDGTTQSVVDVIDSQTLAHEKRFILKGERRTGGSNFSNEGFERTEGSLWLLPEDGPNSTLYRFDLAP